MERLMFEGDFCTIAMCQENPCPYDNACTQPEEIENMKAIQDGMRGNEYIALDERLKAILKAEAEGRLVVLPFPVHSALVNMSDLERPELMKDFRISATWTHCGIVFHSPWGIFSELVKSGSIKRISQEEAMLKGGGEG